MSLTLPGNFLDDIQARDTNLLPLVVLEIPNNTVYISTNSMEFDGAFYKPLLLNIPSLKESIDVEKRNYKISSVNLDISNLPYKGKRFSEIVGEHSLINVHINIYWHSPFSTTINTGAATDVFQIYHGMVRKYEHGDEKVRIVLEDLSQATLHRDLPNTNVGAGTNIPDRYKNKYVPIVFGFVNRSPLVPHYSISDEVSTDEGESSQILEYRLKGDTESLDFASTQAYTQIGNYSHLTSALYFYDNNVYHNVHRTSNNIGESPGAENFRYGLTDIVLDVDQGDYGVVGGEATNDFSEGLLRLHAIRRFNKIEPVYWQNGVINNGNGNLLVNPAGAGIGRITGTVDCKVIATGGYGQTNDWTSGHFKCYLDTITTPSNMQVDADGKIVPPKTTLLIDVEHYNFWDSGQISTWAGTPIANNQFNEDFASMQINALAVPRTHWAVFVGGQASLGWSSTLLHDGLGGGWVGAKYIPNSYNNISSQAIGSTFYDEVVDDLDFFDTLTSFDYINIGIPTFSWNLGQTYESEEADDPQWGVDTKINDAFIVQTYKVMGITDKDYYASVYGRTNDEGNSIIHAPNIISEILGRELNVETTPIGTDQSFGSYAFTVHEKINSKKLIEGIASASPYIPRFNNMGEFKLDTIKEAYFPTDFSSGFTPYTEIKAEDVISNSFSRTSINDVFTRVEFKYKWDYARKLFSNSTIVQIDMLLYDHAYYGLNEDESESTLVIDDDRGKYIRDDTTAGNLAKWLLRFHANQHLKMKVRLPLAYMHVEVGDIVRFDKIIDVKPYGIDYSKNAQFFEESSYPYHGDKVNGQQVFPDFMCLSTNKTMLNGIEIECIQMHNLSDNPRITSQIRGCMNGDAWNYNSLAEVDDGSCLIPPTWDASGNIIPANWLFDATFMQTGVDACYRLIRETAPGAPENIYYENYPPPYHSIFTGDVTMDWGDDIVSDDLGDNNPPPGRYYYYNANHIAAAKTWFLAGPYSPETNTSPNMPKIYRPQSCTSAHIIESYPDQMQIRIGGGGSGLLYGGAGDNFPSESPVQTVLHFEPDSPWGSYSPVYDQSVDVGGVPAAWNTFFYLPFPAWNDLNNDSGLPAVSGGSLINDALFSNWYMGGQQSGELGNLEISFGNIKMFGFSYNDDGTVIHDPTTFPMTEMIISVDPIAWIQHGLGGDPLEEIAIQTTGSITLNSIPNSNYEFTFGIQDLGIKHTGWGQPEDTIVAHSHDIWTIYVRIIIKNQFTIESENVIRVRFGFSGWGGPRYTYSSGWGQ